MAEGVFRKLIEREGLMAVVEIDSAGTHAYHVGERPDGRAQVAAAKRGADISRLRGRRASTEDIRRFDYVLAMDQENYKNLLTVCPAGMEQKIRLFLEFAPNRTEKEVPDPYFGSHSGFDQVLDMIEEAAAGLVTHLRQQHGL